MKLIEYEYLTEDGQKKEKGIILEHGDIIHIINNESPHQEMIIKCNQKKLEILDAREKDTKKEDNQ